ncbi:hypothetical protein F511_29423 [Dorcoceras hygrometricum]|uniref:ERCC4 domain-containing protein n=1 Tax=Dorcoceras hygrometricum TaxID=472368 RepID=A0A2Z7BCL7_9LAMI|nr:hypothetical protein F511_29423 [Dorcoceras hygrometricum]
MVQFHQHIISDLLNEPNGGLVVLSTGLGLPKLISALLSLHDPAQGSLLLLSASSSQRSEIILNHPEISEITSELPAHHRLSLYTSGRVFFITARILIVDLLTSRLPTTSVAGIVVLNAHSLSDTSTEAFIVRILRSSNRSLYVRAFSDSPQSMVSGFAKSERILKCLGLRKLHLWPRFQVYVSQDLERNPPEVIDVRVPMTPHMLGIQKSVIEVMDACLKEMRKTNKVDVEDLTVENGLFKSFDEIVRRQLDPIWHTLGKRTKQLVSDLKTLRKLLDYLSRYDAVTYLKYLDSLRASESFRSVWVFAESSFKIFELAKKRVYSFGRKRKLDNRNSDGNDSRATANNGVVLEETLEAPPKWKVLREILTEIQEERQKQAMVREDSLGGGKDHNGIILVACKDEHTCLQLQDFINNGQHKVMQEEWEKYLLGKVELQALPKCNKNKQKAPKGFGILNGIIPSNSGQRAEVTSISKQENDALLAAAHDIIKDAKRNSEVDGVSEGHDRGRKAQLKKKKSVINESDFEPETGIRSVDLPSKSKDKTNVSHKLYSHESGTESMNKEVLRKHSQNSENTNEFPSVYFHALESDQVILDILQPSFIIVYHPSLAFVREIEIYKAENPSRELKVYFLFYEDSTEVQKFEASVRRENGAFESLIRQKSLMLIPVAQEDNFQGSNSSFETQSIIAQNLITRKAGGRKEAGKEMQVIVDMREFMSSLPNVLDQKGIRIIPVTLEVGDYILSPLICVERKSVQDLFISFSSGRLYHQVEMMSRYYKIPVLLIEFSQDKSFSFQSASDIGDDVTPTSIISKLSLLVLHFPRLRIVWSRSLHATAEIFSTLKANQDEPDEVKAIRVGVPSEEGIIGNDIRAENYNTSAVEFLRRLPGVTDSNYRSIMDGCSSLAELALLPIEKLTELMGGHKAANTLRDFLDAKFPTLL